jgi:hypothetical protein
MSINELRVQPRQTTVALAAVAIYGVIAYGRHSAVTSWLFQLRNSPSICYRPQ